MSCSTTQVATDLRLPICQNAVPKKTAISSVNTNRIELYSARARMSQTNIMQEPSRAPMA